MPFFAGILVTNPQVKATLATLRYYRAFVRSDEQYAECRALERRWDSRLTRQAAQERLGWLVNVAINRKAGIPDVACRKQASDHQAALYRDAGRLMAITRHRVRHYQFETAEVRRRFGHLLSRYDD